MAQAMEKKPDNGLNSLTDCMYFINGRCKLENNCRFRHCYEAVQQTNNCPKWPRKCRNVTCPLRHPTIAKSDKKKPLIAEPLMNLMSQPQPPVIRKGLINFYWDIENVPIPRGQKPFDIVQRIRQKLVIEPRLQEADFSCYCDIRTISEENQNSLHLATVRIVHVPDRKPGGADRQIMLDLDRFERIHKPPATVVLISGDIDFVGKLSDLRHQAGFHVIVIHNRPAKQELKATVNEHYPWEFFTQQQPMQPINAAIGIDPVRNRPAAQIVPRPRAPSVGNCVRRRDPSQSRAVPQNKQPSNPSNSDGKKYPCPKCKNEFDSLQSLRQHQTAKNHLFYCPVCNESFVIKEGQAQHQKDKNHYIESYKCNQCNRFFGKLESLNQHQQATGHMSAVILPTSDRDTQPKDQDDMAIILNGIEAIRDFYMKHIPENN